MRLRTPVTVFRIGIAAAECQCVADLIIEAGREALVVKGSNQIWGIGAIAGRTDRPPTENHRNSLQCRIGSKFGGPSIADSCGSVCNKIVEGV